SGRVFSGRRKQRVGFPSHLSQPRVVSCCSHIWRSATDDTERSSGQKQNVGQGKSAGFEAPDFISVVEYRETIWPRAR
ncbi:hypothetical protein J6590_045060, partial [Homalodisca vitripennis]